MEKFPAMGYVRPTGRPAARPIDRIFQVPFQFSSQFLYTTHFFFENRSLVEFSIGNEHYMAYGAHSQDLEIRMGAILLKMAIFLLGKMRFALIFASELRWHECISYLFFIL